jgi:hypothetical protein
MVFNKYATEDGTMFKIIRSPRRVKSKVRSHIPVDPGVCFRFDESTFTINKLR